MSAYVDDLRHNGWKLYGAPVKSCHLFADTPAELHELAARIGLKRSWAQQEHKQGGLLHYDLVLSKRILALQAGAREITDRRELVALWKRLRGGG